MKKLSSGVATSLTSLGAAGLAILAAKLWGFIDTARAYGIVPATNEGLVGGLSIFGQQEMLYCLGCLCVSVLVASFALARGYMRSIPTFVAASLATAGWTASVQMQGYQALDARFMQVSALVFVGLCWICCTLALKLRDSKRYQVAHLASLSAILLGLCTGFSAEVRYRFTHKSEARPISHPQLNTEMAPLSATIVSLHQGLEPYAQANEPMPYLDPTSLEMKKLLWNWDRAGAAKLLSSKPTLDRLEAWLCLRGAAGLSPGPVSRELLSQVTDQNRTAITSRDGARWLNFALARHHQPVLPIDSRLAETKKPNTSLQQETTNPQACVNGKLLINGQPAAGIRLRLVQVWSPQSLAMTHAQAKARDRMDVLVTNGVSGLLSCHADCVTDAQGHFQMDSLDAKAYLLQCRLEGQHQVKLTSAAPAINLQNGQQLQLGSIELDVH
jgi:hypothetical protein